MTHMRKQSFLKKWWWLICAIFYMPFVVFFYIGKKANNRLWIKFGFVYLILFAVIITLNNLYENESWCKSIAVVYCFIGIVHSFLAWNSYGEVFLQEGENDVEANNDINGQLKMRLMNNNVKIIPFLRFDLGEVQRANTNKSLINIPNGAIGCLSVFAKLCLYILVLLPILIGLVFVSEEDSAGWLIVAGILLFLYCTIHRKYRPEKSFRKYRMKKDNIKKLSYIIYTTIIILGLVLFYIKGFDFRIILALIGAIYGIYYTSKSYSVHEDVDFAVNNEVSELLGFEVDEKIHASYQDDDANRIILVTNRKIYYVFEKGKQKNIVIKTLNELKKIGKFSINGFDDFTLYLIFSDKTKMAVEMDLGDKLTSNPDLFFKKFLEVLDDFLLGRTIQSTVSRRRVTIGKENIAEERSKETDIQSKGRTIDISSSVQNAIKEAIPVNNRNLEL